MRRGTIITFYSYKGGVGRTLAMANIGVLLCRWGYRVLCIDWDLEAPGLHHYFSRLIGPPEQPGLVEWLHSHAEGAPQSWREFLVQVPVPDALHPLSLMPAGAINESYVSRVQQLSWQHLFDRHDLGMVLEQTRSEWKQLYDYVLIDSRTGITDIGGICTVHLPDLLVLLCTANDQSLSGAAEVARRAAAGRKHFDFDRAKLLCLPLATRFETRVEYEIAKEWLHKFTAKLGGLFADWASKDVTAEALLNFVRVPYVPYWSFGEQLPVLSEDLRDPESIGYALETIAALIACKLGGSESLVQNRDSYVAAAKQRGAEEPGTSDGPGIRLFYSYSQADERFREPLERQLNDLKRLGIVETWGDRCIAATGVFQESIDGRLDEADVILFLVSADLLASEYIASAEFRRATERHRNQEAKVLPIILRPVAWALPELGDSIPQGGTPITSLEDQDAAWRQVSRRIREIAAERRRQPTPVPMDPLVSEYRDWAKLPHLAINPFRYGKPVSPIAFVGRKNELRQLFSRIGNGESTALLGPPRMGKTSLLIYLMDVKNREMWLGNTATAQIAIIYLDCQVLFSNYEPEDFLRYLRRQATKAFAEHPGVKDWLSAAESKKVDLWADTRDLFQHLASAHLRLVVLLDEFEEMLAAMHASQQVHHEEIPNFLSYLRSICSLTDALSLVITSTESISRMTKRALYQTEVVPGSPLFNFFDVIQLLPFRSAEAEELYERALAASSVRFGPDERDFLRRMVGRHPYWLQVACAALFDALSDHLPESTRYDQVSEQILGVLAPHFEDLWRRLSGPEQAALVIQLLAEAAAHAHEKDFLMDRPGLGKLCRFEGALLGSINLGLVEAERTGRWRVPGHFVEWRRGTRWRVAAGTFFDWFVRSQQEHIQPWFLDWQKTEILTTSEVKVLSELASDLWKQLAPGNSSAVYRFLRR